MKNRLIPLIFCAALLTSIPIWNAHAAAQPDTTPMEAGPKPPIDREVVVTLDARSNSRSDLTKEIRRYAGFSNHDTVEGKLIHMDAEWLVLADGNSEDWIPRDKVLMLHAHP